MNTKRTIVGAMIVLGIATTSAWSAPAPIPATVGGFVDAQGQWNSTTVNGFTIPNARVFLSKEFRGGVGFVSIPFAFNAAETTSNHSFALGGPKAEGYAEYRFDSGFFGRLGQFATLFGSESLWSDQFRYTSRGILAESLPYVHTGLMVGFGPTEALTIRLLIANRADFGVASSRGPDIAAKFAIKLDMVRFQIGYLLALGGDATARSILDFLLGASGEHFSFDLGFDLFTSPGNTGWGLHGDVAYKLLPTFDFATRFNIGNQLFTRTSGALGTTPSGMLWAWTVGPQFSATTDLRLKADYTLSSVAGATGHSAALAAVYAF